MNDRRELGIAPDSAMPELFAPCRLGPHNTGHMAGVEEQRMGVDVG